MTSIATKHGLRFTRTYQVLHSIKDRCYNPKNKHYHNYGGRGIKVYAPWLDGEDGFKLFCEYMGECPEGMSIDRIDNDGDYCPGNLRWATQEEQMNNTRSNVWYTHGGETKTVAQWAKCLGINISTLWGRLKRWSVERAFTTPVKAKHANL
jgi:hypothetical protein